MIYQNFNIIAKDIKISFVSKQEGTISYTIGYVDPNFTQKYTLLFAKFPSFLNN